MMKKILVVEDNEDNRRILVYRLRKIGQFDIREAANGQQALEAVKADRPDLIFMDIKMPQMDGIELLQRIKRADPSIEVVMITAYASLDTVRNALTHGAFEYLIKPFSRKDLEDTAKRALARRRVAHRRPLRTWSSTSRTRRRRRRRRRSTGSVSVRASTHCSTTATSGRA